MTTLKNTYWQARSLVSRGVWVTRRLAEGAQYMIVLTILVRSTEREITVFQILPFL